MYKSNRKQKYPYMKTKDIESLFLNIDDIIEIFIKDFSYKLNKKEKNNCIVDVEQNKKTEEGWIPCPTIRGVYYGEDYSSESNKKLDIIKIFPSEPFKITPGYYLTFTPSQVTAITIIQKKKADIDD